NVFLPENIDIRKSDKLFDQMTVFLGLLMKRWLSMAKGDQALVPRLQGNATYEEILKILSMQECSNAYQIRALEYRSFKSRLYEYLKKSPTAVPTLEFLKGMGEDYERVQENINSLTDLLDLHEEGFSEVLDQFLRAPLLS